MRHVNPLVLETKSAETDTDETIVLKAVGDLQAAFEQKMAKVEGELKSARERADALELKLNRPGNGGSASEPGIEQKAFGGFLRKGVERLPIEEVKALTVGTDANGGYLAPEQFGSELIKNLVQFSPIRQYARVVTIGAVEVKYPRRTAGTTASWVSETGSRSSSQPTFSQVTLTPYELATYTDVSTALLEDNAYNLEGELSMDWAESFGAAEGAAFVEGDGSGKPNGLLTASGIASVNSGNAAAITADALIGMFYTLPAPFRNRGTWLMNSNTLADVRLLKDGQGNYLWRAGIAEGQPETLLGRPVVEAVDMPDVEAAATPIILGDLQGYRIVDRVTLSVLRDPFTLATTGQVRFHARKRVGGDVTHADRFVKMAIAA
jgi:HK97 family phage major capsid protein